LAAGRNGDSEGLDIVDQALLLGRIRNLLVGQDPLDREDDLEMDVGRQHLGEYRQRRRPDAVGLAGRLTNLPAYKVMAELATGEGYASTIPILECRKFTPITRWLQKEGYIAYKIHPHYFWNPETGTPTPGRPSNIKADIETCHLVRQAVGPDYVLMFDPWARTCRWRRRSRSAANSRSSTFIGTSTRCGIPGRELRAALSGTYHPDPLPEIAAGGVFTRAEWILRGASDMSRIDVVRGGITGARKTAIVCEAYGLRCEMHMAGWGNLQVCGATRKIPASTTRRACWRRASTTMRRTRT